MEIVQRLLNTEEVSYSSNLKQEILMKRIEDLFEKRNLGLTVKLISENEFTAYDKLVVVSWRMPYLKRKSAYLNGKITPTEKGSLIKLKVNPNSALAILAVLSTISGFIFTAMGLLNTEGNSYFLIFGLVFIVLGIIYYSVSTLLRKRLRNKIVNYLDLKKVE